MRRIPMYLLSGRLAVAVLLALSISSVPPRVFATERAPTVEELQQKLDQSLKAIEALTERVRELEARQPVNAPAPPPAPAAAAAPSAADAARLEAVEQQLDQLETANANRSNDNPGMPMHGFADVGAGTHNPVNPDLEGFYVGNLDLYMTPRLSDRTRALFELNTEISSEGTVDVDLERAQIGYQLSDQATIWMGRFHSPYGYINTALHHGSWINNSLRRPRFLQFEDNGGIVPAHTVGLWLTGAQHLGTGKLQYDTYVGNSQQITEGVLDMRNAGTMNGNMIVGGRLGYLFNAGAAEGLTLGVHAFGSRIGDDATPANLTRVLSYGGYAVYDTEQWENIIEFYLFDDENLTGAGGTHSSHAGFVQLGYRAPWGVPYARYELTVLNQADNYFASMKSGGSYHRTALGLRFDVSADSALKIELADTQLTDRTRDQFSEGLMQYAIRF